MAYTRPPTFAHGDQTMSAANGNIWRDDMEYLNSILDGYSRALYPMDFGTECQIPHAWRWLWYATRVSDTSNLKDPSGVNPDVSLPYSTTLVAFDLSQVSWLTQGQWYRVTGCAYAAEDIDP